MPMMLAASEKKGARARQKLRKDFHCLPLANTELYPGTVLIQASLLGEPSADWLVFSVKRQY